MNKTVRLLKWAYYIPILLGLLMIVLFESNVFPVGIWVSEEHEVVEFYLEITMMLLAVDRKSTRLNSSHANISYAVFCLKKKSLHFDHSTCYSDDSVSNIH